MNENQDQEPEGFWLAHWPIVVAAVIAVLIGTGLGFTIRGVWEPEPIPVAEQAQTAPAGEETTWWTCSMHPQVRMPGPGLCPLCPMELIPLKQDIRGGLREFATSDAGRALMDIETSPVERRFVTAEVRMVGQVDYDETRLAHITAWVPGRLVRLFVDFTGIAVRKGDHMVELYSPDLFETQAALLEAIKSLKDLGDNAEGPLAESFAGTVRDNHERLRLWGLTDEQIAEIETRGTAADRMTINAPRGGIVVHRNAQQGMYVKTGSRIYSIADLSQVWVKLDAYESDLMWLRYGQKIQFATVSYPGETFTGTIAFIDPVLNPRTRTVKVRVNATNDDGRLKPEMFVKAVVHARFDAAGKVMDENMVGKWICPMHPDIVKPDPGTCDICQMALEQTEALGYVSVTAASADKPLVVPASAVLRTGTRAIVYVELPDKPQPTFQGREIVLGPRAGDYFIVRSGLKQGQRVVTRGNFKIDSALQLQGKPSMMNPAGGAQGGGHDHGAHGGAAKTQGQDGTAGAIKLSALSQRQIRTALAAAEEVAAAVAADDLAALSAALAAAAKAIESVDMKLLAGRAHAVWEESAMRMTNDAVEGQQATAMAEARRFGESLARHARSLKDQLGLSVVRQDDPLTAVDPTFRRQLQEVFQGYRLMQQALADDEADAAVAAAGQAQQSLAGVDMSLLTGEAHDVWMKRAASLKQHLSAAAVAKDIDGAREALASLSVEIAAVAKAFGPPGGEMLYELKCPMAFNSRGATWLQWDDQTRNPYFGTTMLRCGDVVDMIPVVKHENEATPDTREERGDG